MHSGKGGKPAFQQLNVGDHVLVEIAVRISSILSVENPDLWDLITWASSKGKVAAIIGGPPCRTFSRLRNRGPGPPPVRSRTLPFGWELQPEAEYMEVVKDTRLFVRTIWTHALAVAGRDPM